ncbi:MAG: tellurite resistance TerB family protein [Pseudomonadota bacterium]
MFDAKRLLDQFTGAGAGGGNLGGMLQGKKGLATGAVAGGLATYLLAGKKPKKLAKNALKFGGMAVIGGLAYKAWSDYQAGQAPATAAPAAGAAPAEPVIAAPPAGTPFLPEAPAEQDLLGRALLRAMIAAAKADGHIDADEQRRIFGHIDQLELDADDKAFVFEELSKPLDVAAVAEPATTPEMASEIYAASLLAIDADGPAERGYLAMLAARLNLPADLVAHLHANVDAATDSA